MTILSKFLKFLVIVLLVWMALHFRTYPLRELSSTDTRFIRQEAEKRVSAMIASHIAPEIHAQFSHLSSEQRNSLVLRQVEQIKNKDRKNYRQSVQNIEKTLTESRQQYFSAEYLSEADPYYYLKLTKNVLETGSLGPEMKQGAFYNPLRYLPNGRWDPLTLHPYLGAGWHLLLTQFNAAQRLMGSLSLFPLALTVLAVLAFVLLGHALGMSFFMTSLGCTVFILSPILLQRSNYGWYDTDPYNVLFPMFILTILFVALKESRPRVNLLWSIFSALLTALFALFWAGWAFLFLLVLGAVLCLIFLPGRTQARQGDRKSFIAYAGGYFLFTLLFVVAFISPKSFFEALTLGFDFILKAGGSTVDSWPNLFVYIGETNSVSLAKFIYLISNEITFIVALIGVGAEFMRCARAADPRLSRRGIALFIFSVPLFFLSLKAERYVLLFVLPFSIFVMLGAEQICAWGAHLLKKIPSQAKIKLYGKVLVLGLCGLLIVPRTLISAHIGASISHVIMNDAWYKPLQYLKDNSAPDSIVFSWWSPGHFVTAIAERQVAVDGGAQSLRENYWIARALMSQNESESCGIFRMLAAGGNQAQEWLEKKGWTASRAVELLGRVIQMSSAEALRELPDDWSSDQRNELIRLTHGAGTPRPSYVMVYDDLIRNNMLLQLTANWDFLKAEDWLKRGGAENLSKGQKGYTQRLLKIAGQPLPYQVGLKAVRKQDSLMVFENGLLVDFSGPKAFLSAEEGEPDRRLIPMNLVLQKSEGNWVENRPESGKKALLEVIVAQQDQTVAAVVAHRDLVNSVLFRLHYTDGRGLKYFQHVVSEYAPHTQTKVRIYQINWQDYLGSL